jgi:hypothetical protein
MYARSVKVYPESKAEAIFWVVLGLVLGPAAGFILFVKLDVLHVPGLIHHFPQAYALLAAFLVAGVFFTAAGVIWLLRHRT